MIGGQNNSLPSSLQILHLQLPSILYFYYISFSRLYSIKLKNIIKQLNKSLKNFPFFSNNLKGNNKILCWYNNYCMKNYFQYPSNPEGSLKIYEPPRHQIQNHLYSLQSNTVIHQNPQSKSYLKKETIIDQLGENREENTYRSDNNQEYYYGKTPSIQDLVDMIGKNSNKFLPPLPQKIQKQEYASPRKNKIGKEVEIINNETPKDNFTNLLKLSKNSQSHIVLPSFPSKQYLNDSPDKSLSRPFLRKKTTSEQGEQWKRQESYEMVKISNQINTLKEYNNNLTSVMKNIRAIKSNDSTQNLQMLGLKPLSLFKLMVQKAIIAKEECD